MRTPEDHDRLGLILRLSVASGDLNQLQAFLEEYEVAVPQDQLEAVRDLLVAQRIDLVDLGSAARDRLRVRVLVAQDSTEKTADYLREEAAGFIPRCRSCQYFVKAPNDGTPNGDQPCVALGTRGADVACFGYTKKF